MDLSFERPGDYLFVRRVGERAITVAERDLRESFLLLPDRIVEHWPVTDIRSLEAQHVEPMLALQPELVLLGSGARQAFPAPAFLAGFLRKGVGIEVMDNAATARTYDLLAGEGRRVLAAFILPAAPSAS